MCKTNSTKCQTERCHAVISSASWERRHEDPLADKQRWYCPNCGARYKCGFGVLVEFLEKGQTYYCKAEFPEQDIQDMKWMSVENGVRRAGHRDLKEARELLNLVPHVAPACKQTFQPTVHEGVFLFDPRWMESLPDLDWNVLYKLAKDT